MKTTFLYCISKRITDIIISIIGLIVLFPIFIIVSVLIKISSKGPIFYKGRRSGKFERPFYIYKFRSMYLGSETLAGSTSRNDPRITFIGKFIRKFKIDELPQLLNVLMGKMSLVGPRPELPRYTKNYKDEELLILQVKPGITDLASIKFSNLNELIDDFNPDLSYENNVLKEKNKLRIEYVKSRKFWFDFRVILLTISKILFNK
ncbi:MAG: sugar transferase [Mariniphaga sp.]|nr:sugar transferase [Mariniphaga sp.]